MINGLNLDQSTKENVLVILIVFPLVLFEVSSYGKETRQQMYLSVRVKEAHRKHPTYIMAPRDAHGHVGTYGHVCISS